MKPGWSCSSGQGRQAVRLRRQSAGGAGRAAARARPGGSARGLLHRARPRRRQHRRQRPRDRRLDAATRAIAACAWSRAGTTCSAACWNSAGRCRGSRSSPIRSSRTISIRKAGAAGHGAADSCSREYNKYLAAWLLPLLRRAKPPAPPVIRTVRRHGGNRSAAASVGRRDVGWAAPALARLQLRLLLADGGARHARAAAAAGAAADGHAVRPVLGAVGAGPAEGDRRPRWRDPRPRQAAARRLHRSR